ncbi:hypothetical protein C8T65DRAFT_643819 [Cerioporus squamosus]|nr:hypothetical protein C8T65DRAFT_643819 [Cerioporus squamosus]
MPSLRVFFSSVVFEAAHEVRYSVALYYRIALTIICLPLRFLRFSFDRLRIHVKFVVPIFAAVLSLVVTSYENQVTHLTGLILLSAYV